MDLNNLSYFKAITTRMHWLTARQSVLAENVANSDTPNYQAKDLSQPDFSRFLQNSGAAAHSKQNSGHTVSLRRTHADHLGAGGSNGGTEMSGNVRASAAATNYESTPSGNAVILEEEMIKITKSAGDFAMMTNVYKKGVTMLKMAVSKGR
jgi:flagellar basal-body rod protein FlgB